MTSPPDLPRRSFVARAASVAVLARAALVLASTNFPAMHERARGPLRCRPATSSAPAPRR